MRTTWTTHVRQLRQLLVRAMVASRGDVLELAPSPAVVPSPDTGQPSPEALTPQQVQAALDQANGKQEVAWRALGLQSRYQLRRLIKRHGLVVRREPS